RHPAMVRQQTEIVRAQKHQIRQELGAVLSASKPLEAYWKRRVTAKDESPLQVLRGLRMPDGRPLIGFQETKIDGTGLRAALERTFLAGQGVWYSPADPQIRFAGTTQSCDGLNAWGANTRRVLEPALAILHD